ncbi:hypothetical protein B0H14DRAFT_3140512, partial [Mycena olivaceomarginata]
DTDVKEVVNSEEGWKSQYDRPNSELAGVQNLSHGVSELALCAAPEYPALNPIPLPRRSSAIRFPTAKIKPRSKTPRARSGSVICPTCRIKIGRAADLDRHIFTVHRSREDNAALRCGGCRRLLSREDSRRRHESVCLHK